MKNTRIIFFCTAFLFLACNNSAQNNSVQNKAEPVQEVSEPTSTANNKTAHTALTKEQVEAFFPEQLGDYKRFNVDVSLLKSKEMASATYVRNNDFNHTLVYTLEDGMRKKSGILKKFETSYTSELKGPEGTEYIKKERDGNKTIAFLQPKINRNQISFVYKNHFKLSLEGVEEPDALWLYVHNEDLKKLDNY
jgi:hypothetical protein